MNSRSEIVSDAAERLILVDDQDQQIGTLDKQSCHDGRGQLHRAFSLFIFNLQGELLVQQRASGKRLWPSFWSNSCCSHPRAGESMEVAVQRRCEQELGFTTPLTYLYKFQYSAQFGDAGSENELCSVYVGTWSGEVRPNRTEVQAFDWLSAPELDARLQNDTGQFTPWFIMEWQRLRQDFARELPGAIEAGDSPQAL